MSHPETTSFLSENNIEDEAEDRGFREGKAYMLNEMARYIKQRNGQPIESGEEALSKLRFIEGWIERERAGLLK